MDMIFWRVVGVGITCLGARSPDVTICFGRVYQKGVVIIPMGTKEVLERLRFLIRDKDVTVPDDDVLEGV